MAYVPPATLNDLLVSWSATYSIANGFSASLKVRNPNKVIDSQALLWDPIKISTAATVSDSLGTTVSQYTGTTEWVIGIVSHVDEDEDEVEGDEILDIKLTDYFNRLRDRPINTQTYNSAFSTILPDVLTTYCGVPAALYTVSTGHGALFNGNIQGDSVYSELELLARAAWSDMFVQVGGNLEFGLWKDAGSSVDYTLTDEAVLNMKFPRTIDKAPTLIYVRGGYQSLLGCGLRVISGEPNSQPSKIGRDRCAISGAVASTMDIGFKNLEGNKEALRNAGFVFTGDAKFESVNIPKDGQEGETSVNVSPSTGTTFDSGILQETNYLILSKDHEQDVISGNSSRGRSRVERERKQDKLTSRLSGVAPGVATGRVSLSADQTEDSADKGRLNFGLLDTTLAGDYGIVNGSIDNPYITNSLVAFRVAIREFQETRMKRRFYELETVYMPDLRLNHVIQFKDKAANTIKGRIIEISVGHDVATAETTMKLLVEGFNDLGALTYSSDNLLVYPELCGINGVDWVVGSGDVYAVGSGFFAFDGASSVTQPLTLITSLTYTCSFTVTLLSATGSMSSSCGPGSSPVITASGNYSYTSVPVVESNTLDFTITSGQWLLSSPSLTVIASGF